ncbi:STAS domain-containing protein [Thermopolyspora sp. NPDC052614]|uniref:STAS domain-containing protein n=1 Tax=Thermopolyspora sp. NPDC052614 TaxID=3155682 RepID=UPI0034319EC7
MSTEESEPELDIHREDRRRCTVLHLVGNLGGEAPTRLRDEMVPAMRGRVSPCIVLDLQGVDTADLNGIASLIAALKRLRSAGGRLMVAATPQQVLRSLEERRLDRPFDFYDDLAQALHMIESSG